MATFTSKATGNWNAAGQTTWNEVGVPVAGDIVIINIGHTITQVQNEACAVLTCLGGSTLNQATFNLVMTGNFATSGTHIIGTSAGTGLTCVGYVAITGAVLNFQGGSKINNSGNLFLNSNLFVNKGNGIYTQTGNGTFITGAGNFWRSFILNAGITFTATGDSQLTGSENGSLITNIQGILDCALYTVRIGANQVGTFTIGANADIQGSHILRVYRRDGCVTVNNKTTPFSFTGIIEYLASISYAGNMLVGDWTLADVRLFGIIGNLSYTLSDGITRIKDLIVDNASTGDTDLYLDPTELGYDPELIIYGDVKAKEGGGSFDFRWYKGTTVHNLTLCGNADQTFEFNCPDEINPIVLDCAGYKRTLKDDIITSRVSGNGRITTDVGESFRVRVA